MSYAQKHVSIWIKPAGLRRGVLLTSSRLSIPIRSLFLLTGFESWIEFLPTTTSPTGRAYLRGAFFQPLP